MLTSKISITTIAISAALLASAAEAKTRLTDVDGQATVAPFNVAAKTVEGWDVYSAAGEKIGKVEEAVGAAKDKPTVLVVDFRKGTRYRDRQHVVIPLDRFSRSDEKLVLQATPRQVAKLEKHASQQHTDGPDRPSRTPMPHTPAPDGQLSPTHQRSSSMGGTLN